MSTATAPAPPTPSETTKRCDASKVKPGAVFSRHSFGTVVDSARRGFGGTFRVKNAQGFEWEIGAEILEREFSFADQFDGEEKVTRTRVIEILTENPHTAMTVAFHKAVDPKAVAEATKAGQGAMSDREWAKHVGTLCEGEAREMIGHHAGTWDEHRRLHFVEMAKGPRLVDPRTIDWLIVGRMKFVVKK